MIVSNIGITPDFSAIYTSNSGQHTAFVQVSLKEGHKIGSYEYMDRVRAKLARRPAGALHLLPDPAAWWMRSLNLGLPAPIDIQVSGNNLEETLRSRHRTCRARSAALPGVSDVLIPQDIDYPGAAARRRTARWPAELGLTQQEVVDNVITALTSNGMIAPSYWVDPKSGNNYLLTVQYPEDAGEDP